jgi:hypothetical protein
LGGAALVVEVLQMVLLLDHQSAVQPIGLARTLEEFALVENMWVPDILLLLLARVHQLWHS